MVPFGPLDMFGLLHTVSRSDIIRYTIQQLETYLKLGYKQSQEHGAKARQLSVLFDMDGFNIKQYTYRSVAEVVIQMIKMYEANYPEILKFCYIINGNETIVAKFKKYNWNISVNCSAKGICFCVQHRQEVPRRVHAQQDPNIQGGPQEVAARPLWARRRPELAKALRRRQSGREWRSQVCGVHKMGRKSAQGFVQIKRHDRRGPKRRVCGDAHQEGRQTEDGIRLQERRLLP